MTLPLVDPADPAQHPAGSICWVDLGITDVDTAAAFYSALLGWQVDPPDRAGYRLAYLPGRRPVAALGPAEDPGTPYWTVYASVLDATATARAAVAAGGLLATPAVDAGEAGVAAAVRDPAGAPLSLWQPGTHPGTWATGEPGAVADVQLRTDRPQDSQPFLHATLGWDLRDRRFVIDGRAVATWAPPAADLPRQPPSPWLVRFHVHDVDASTRRAVALGGHALHEAGTLRDPAGAVLGLVRATTPHTQGA